MDKKIIIAALLGSVVSFLLGWLVYGILLMDFYSSHMNYYHGLMKDPPNLAAIFAGGLAMSFLIAYIYRKWSGTTSFATGFMNGLIIGFLVSLSFNLYMYASMDLYARRVIVVGVITGTLFNAVLGGVIGWYLGMGNKNEVTA